jgi:hypothetical protein
MGGKCEEKDGKGKVSGGHGGNVEMWGNIPIKRGMNTGLNKILY